jgi:hypothetical protein
MATYLIQVKDGTDTVAVIDPITFKNANLVNLQGSYYITINSTYQGVPAGSTAPYAAGDFSILFSSAANAKSALAQIYTDLNAYYNA